MINGIQIIIYLPLLACAFPANALMIIDNILMIATFDIPYCDMDNIFGPDLWDYGDDSSILEELANNDLLLSGLNALGFSSRMISSNLGSMFIIMLISFVLLGVIAIVESVMRIGHKNVKRSHRAVSF